MAAYGTMLLLLCRPYISVYLDRASRLETEAVQKSVLVRNDSDEPRPVGS